MVPATGPTPTSPSSAATNPWAAPAAVTACPVASYIRGLDRLSIVPAMVVSTQRCPHPDGASVYGADEPSKPAYMVGPNGWTCTGLLASADGGMSMEALQTSSSGFVYQVLEAGGIGANMSDAC